MKKLIIFLLIVSPIAVTAQTRFRNFDTGWEPRPAARRNVFDRTVRYIGHQARATVTDLRHPEWALLVAGEVAVFIADEKSTRDGFAHGFREKNPLYQGGPTSRTLKASGVHFGILVLTHSWHDEVIAWCAQDGDKVPGFLSAKSCGHTMWLIPATHWPREAWQTACNERLIDGGCRVNIHPKAKIPELLPHR